MFTVNKSHISCVLVKIQVTYSLTFFKLNESLRFLPLYFALLNPYNSKEGTVTSSGTNFFKPECLKTQSLKNSLEPLLSAASRRVPAWPVTHGVGPSAMLGLNRDP